MVRARRILSGLLGMVRGAGTEVPAPLLNSFPLSQSAGQSTSFWAV